MREREESVRGYRILGDRPKPDKRFNDDALRQTAEAAHLLDTLWKVAPPRPATATTAAYRGTNCYGKEDQYTSDELPSDEEAAYMCGDCPALQLCRTYAKVSHISYGVWGGEAYGRHLNELIGDE